MTLGVFSKHKNPILSFQIRLSCTTLILPWIFIFSDNYLLFILDGYIRICNQPLLPWLGFLKDESLREISSVDESQQIMGSLDEKQTEITNQTCSVFHTKARENEKHGGQEISFQAWAAHKEESTIGWEEEKNTSYLTNLFHTKNKNPLNENGVILPRKLKIKIVLCYWPYLE